MRPRFTLRRTRSVQVIIATTMLAVPASAFALTGATTRRAVRTELRRSARPSRSTCESARTGSVSVDAVTVTGTAPATDAGRRVVLQTAAPGSADVAPDRSDDDRRAAAGSGSASVPRRSGTGPRAGAGGAERRWRPASLTFAGATVQRAAAGDRVGSVHARCRSGGRRRRRCRPISPAGCCRRQQGRVVRLQGHTPAGLADAGDRSHRRPRRLPAELRRRRPGAGQRLRMLFGGDRRNGRTVQGRAAWPCSGRASRPGMRTAAAPPAAFTPVWASPTARCRAGPRSRSATAAGRVTAVVDDRGPYVGGRTWDLNQNTAAALGFSGVGTVWTSLGRASPRPAQAWPRGHASPLRRRRPPSRTVCRLSYCPGRWPAAASPMSTWTRSTCRSSCAGGRSFAAGR